MRRSEPLTWALVLLCVLATANMEWRGLDSYAAGAICAPVFWHGSWTRALTAIFLHGGWFHLALNALALWVLGHVIARGLGRFPMLFFLLGSALAGLAASLLLLEPDIWRVGISGGIAGLVGLILAVEWAVARDRRAFLASRNVRVILFLIVLNAGLAVATELFWKGVKLDHAAHVAGLLYGLAAGRLWFPPRRRPRPAFGLVGGALLALLPLVYAAAPRWSDAWRDPRQHVFAAALAWEHGEKAHARRGYAKAHELDPTLLEPAARLALIDDDPALLDSAAEPKGFHEAFLLGDTLLQLAGRRLETDPAQAAELVGRAQRIGPVGPRPWQEFADHARAAGRAELAAVAEREAVRRERRASLAGASPEAASKVLESLRSYDLRGLPPEQRLAAARERARLVWEAAARLADGDLPEAMRASEQRALEKDLLEAVDEARGAGRGTPAVARAETALRIKRAWRRLAENAPVEARVPRFRLYAAHWAEEEYRAATDAGVDPADENAGRLAEEIEGLYRAARTEGFLYGDPVAVAQAGHWLRQHGITPPGPESGRGPGDD